MRILDLHATPNGPFPMVPRRSGSERPLLVILGPTGVGKTEIAYRSALQFGGEVIGFDSIQVYRGMDAGTAKPSREQRERVPHHCIDVADPGVEFSLGDFVRAAEVAIGEIRRRGFLPILAGGTGLYLQGLLHGILDLPARMNVFRDRLRRCAEKRGTGYLHMLLRRLDPVSAERIAPADQHRIMRGLEVRLATGLPWSDHISERGSVTDRFPNLKVGLIMDRRELYRALDRRVEKFFSEGLLEEVDRLLRNGCPPGINSLKAIGYREALRHLNGEISLDEAIRRTQKSTRQYAKRQWTWFKRISGVRWFRVDEGLDWAWEQISAHIENGYCSRTSIPA